MAPLRTVLAAATLLLVPLTITAQGFDVDAYRAFLREVQGLSASGLEARYQAGLFTQSISAQWSSALHADSIDKYYALTAYEKSLLDRHGFMVTERQRWESFGEAFREIYGRDLPVFVSTDAILHAVHMSYDRILMELEARTLSPGLDTALGMSHSHLRALADRYRSNPAMASGLSDVDLFLTVARSLLHGTSIAPLLPANASLRDQLLTSVRNEGAEELPIFGSAPRMIDFSQFKPRGHYTLTPELERYFRTMIWLGRIELYLDPPASVADEVPEEDVRHQTVMSALLAEAFAGSGAISRLGEIDRAITLFVGEQDNVTVEHIRELMTERGIADAAGLLDRDTWLGFRDLLRTKPYARQRILSQMLRQDPFDEAPIEPASSMMLLGQRFILDSYVMANVVFDKVESKRMLPSSLDVLFALGNDAAAQLLEPELNRYNYSSNLAGMRYIVDTYDPAYWESTIYGGWLNAIRTLAPPQDRTGLPQFMRTAAWWQQKMNTQLASWAQLRHDNLLYAKQSYTGMPGCSYPHVLIEPIPEFFASLRSMAERSAAIMDQVDPVGLWEARTYFQRVAEISDTLEGIASKEVNGEGLTDADVTFLRAMLFQANAGCVTVPDGWYPRFYYERNGDDLREKNLVVADVHTSPADQDGNLVGWVMHVGTGLLDMGVVLHAPEGGELVAYVGPVMSYHERVTQDFLRFTDEEWQNEWETAPSARPALVNLYLANRDGQSRGDHVSLHTAPALAPQRAERSAGIVASVRPVPSDRVVTLDFTVPPSGSGATVRLEIVDPAGRLVATVVDEALPQGDYSVRWPAGEELVAPGVYHYRLQCGEEMTSGSFVLAGR